MCSERQMFAIIEEHCNKVTLKNHATDVVQQDCCTDELGS
jgi:hypothetical protein